MMLFLLQVHKAEKRLTHSKEEHEIEIRAIQAQAEHIRDEVCELKNATSHSIADSSDRIHRLQVSRDVLRFLTLQPVRTLLYLGCCKQGVKCLASWTCLLQQTSDFRAAPLV